MINLLPHLLPHSLVYIREHGNLSTSSGHMWCCEVALIFLRKLLLYNHNPLYNGLPRTLHLLSEIWRVLDAIGYTTIRKGEAKPCSDYDLTNDTLAAELWGIFWNYLEKRVRDISRVHSCISWFYKAIGRVITRPYYRFHAFFSVWRAYVRSVVVYLGDTSALYGLHGHEKWPKTRHRESRWPDEGGLQGNRVQN